jgi:hypothetical protein
MVLRLAKHLIIIFSILLIITSFSCKKNSTSPQVDSLTKPVIWLNTFEMSFSVIKSERNPEPQVLEIKNTGIDTLSYDLSCEADWLEVDPMSGSSSGKMKRHEVKVKKAGLKAQEEPYATSIMVTDTNSYNNPQEVKVSLTVSKEPPPKIRVNPKNLDFTAQQGGSDPPPQTIEIVNTGEGTLKFEIETNVDWLNVNPDSGNSKTNAKTHTVSCSIGGLNIGTHNGTLTIRDPNATNNPQTVEVSIKITKEPPPKIWISTKTINMEAFEDGRSPSKAFFVKNSGGGTLNYEVEWDASWMSVSPDGGTSAGPERKHTVRTDISGRSVGTYRGTITIRDNKAANSPQQVDVKLRIKEEAPPPPPPPEPELNRIGPFLDPGSADPGTTIRVEIKIIENQREISAFGFDLNFDPDMFDYVGTSNGGLTGGWSVGGNQTNPGKVIVGGWKVSASSIPVGRTGNIAVVQLRVTGSSYDDGTERDVSMSGYDDDIGGMKPEPAKATFTLNKE